MRLVTYDRGGARRLGAWVDGTVVDLPDAVGHPSFPTTMERLVEHSGGTILEAAREILSRPDEASQFAVPGARLLAPLLPRALRESGQSDPPLVLGPDDQVPMPRSGSLGLQLELGCVIGTWGRNLGKREAEAAIFGYTLVNDWSISGRQNGRDGRAANPRTYVAFSFGPCIVTTDEFDREDAAVEVRVDGRIRSKGTFKAVPSTFASLVAESSRGQEVAPGDLYGSGPRARTRTDLHPGAVVEVEAEGIGVLRTIVGHRARSLARRR